jgi:hypothetical protein
LISICFLHSFLFGSCPSKPCIGTAQIVLCYLLFFKPVSVFPKSSSVLLSSSTRCRHECG